MFWPMTLWLRMLEFRRMATRALRSLSSRAGGGPVAFRLLQHMWHGGVEINIAHFSAGAKWRRQLKWCWCRKNFLRFLFSSREVVQVWGLSVCHWDLVLSILAMMNKAPDSPDSKKGCSCWVLETSMAIVSSPGDFWWKVWVALDPIGLGSAIRACRRSGAWQVAVRCFAHASGFPSARDWSYRWWVMGLNYEDMSAWVNPDTVFFFSPSPVHKLDLKTLPTLWQFVWGRWLPAIQTSSFTTISWLCTSRSRIGKVPHLLWKRWLHSRDYVLMLLVPWPLRMVDMWEAVRRCHNFWGSTPSRSKW